jgi:methionyl-tRNA synthetase
MSAGISLPKAIYVHGFVTSGGHKMSKSLGNVVNPLEYIEKYGVDAVRWYLLKEIPTTDDGDFSQGRFLEVYNSELANGLGNLVNRVVMMTERYVGGKVPAVASGEGVSDGLKGFMNEYVAALEKYDLKRACECVVAIVDLGNKYVDDKKPWVMAKGDDLSALAAVLYNLLELLRHIVVLLIPILPGTALKIANQIGIGVDEMELNDGWGTLKEGCSVSKGEPLFPKLLE